MKITDIEKLNQLVSRTDMTGNEKVQWLTNFIDNHVTEQLHISAVNGCDSMQKFQPENTEKVQRVE